ncbi:hypothetical protein PMN64_11295 [Bradyrhizobium sp. UFLA01-814]|uniref:hypothetical protein n=1 Tax=Bradyrhizobium sp. UFLA01-814 TaxID=3023480 RepID=UPI00398BB85D
MLAKSIFNNGWILALIGIALSGCGTVVPDIQEFWGTPKDAANKVEQISAQVVCELRRAVQRVLWEGRHRQTVFIPNSSAPPPPPVQHLDWFEQTWGVQVTLNLNIAENSGVAPGVSFIRNWSNSQSFTAGLGGSLSSTATRTDKLNMFFTVQELADAYNSMKLTCITDDLPKASLFVVSDLKLYDWLHAALLPNTTNIIAYQNSKNPTNVIQHEVKFQIVSNGSATPSWKLVEFTANTSGSFLTAGRDRTQDLTITFGPLADGAKPKVAVSHTGRPVRTARSLELSTPAENAHLAAQIGLAVSQSLK